MGKLVFRVASNWQEVVRLRNEIEKLKQTLLSMESTQSPDTFKKLNAQLGESAKKMNILISEAAKTGAAMENDFKKKVYDASQSVNVFTEKIIVQKAVVKDIESDVRRLGDAYRIALKRNSLSAGGKLDEWNASKKSLNEEKAALFELTQEQATARLSVTKLRQEYSLYKDDSTKVISANDSIASSMKEFILTIAGADAIKDFISNVIDTAGNFQKMEAVLANSLGNTSKAKETMDMLADFGAKTPFQVDELTAAYVKLANQGFTPTMEQMRKLGDLASSTGKSFDQLAEAIIDAQVGENERLKEFGIRASKNGDLITYTFKEQETTVKNTASAIREYILSLGNLEGVMGANEKISATFVGRLSNIEDELTNQFKDFGEKFNSELSAGINFSSLLVENLNKIIPVIGGLVTAYGSYKAAVVAVSAAHKAGALYENIRLIGMMRKELGLATAAQQAFNAASKANIYAVLLAALIGIGTAVYMFTKKTDEATDAQKKLSNASVELNAEIGKETKVAKDLFDKLKKAKVGTNEYSDAKQKVLDNYGKYISGMNKELDTIEKINAAYNESTKAVKRYVTEKLKAQFVNTGVGDASGKQAEALKIIRDNILKDVGGENGGKLFDSIKEQLSQNKDNDYLDIVKQLKKAGIKDDAFGYGKAITSAIVQYKKAAMEIKQTFKDADDLYSFKNENTGSNTQSNVTQEITNVTKKIAVLKTELADLRSGKTKVEVGKTVESVIDGKKKELQEAEKSLETLTGISTTKQESAAEKLRKEQEKYTLLVDKQKLSQIRAEEDAANEIEQFAIDRLKDGSEKTLRQRALNHRKELETIKREAEDNRRKVIEEGRVEFESNPENKKRPFNAEDFIKTEPAKKKFAIIENVAKENKTTSETKYNRGDDLTGLLDEYQDYTDKRLAIETKFNKDLAVLDEQRETAVKNGDTQQVEQIDRAKAQATANKGKSLMGLDYDKLKESPEYVRAFENLKETSSETLNSLLTQLENAKQTAAEVLSPDQLREYTTTIQEIMDELDSRNPFQALTDKKQELADAEEELANAQRELENAKQTAEAVKGGAKIENGISSSKFNVKTGKIDSTKIYLSEAKALDKVKDKTDKYNKAKDNVVKTSAKVKKAEKDVKNQIDDLFNAMNDLGNSIGGQAGEIISLISDIGSFTMFAMEGVKAAADTSANAISTVEKASVILAIISAAVQVATKIAKLFKGESDEEKRKKQIDFYNQIISIYDKIIEKQKESIKFGYGFSSIEAAKKAMEDLNKQTEYYRKIANTSFKMFVGDKSLQYIKAMKELGVDVKESLLGIATSDELSQLSAKQLEYIRDNYKDLWASLKDEQRDALQAIIDAEDKSKKIVDEWKESITGISYDSFYTEFIDTLSDMDSSAEDMANNFGDYLRKSILAAMVAKEFQKDIDNLYEMWVAAGDEKSDGGIEITVDEAKKIQQKQKELTEAMIKRREEMEKAYGFDSSTSSQESTKKGFAAASQDSIDELNGRFTALQIAGEETKNQNILQSQSLNILTVKADSILSVNTDTRNIADEIRTIQVNSYLELQEIRENTGAIIKPIKDMAADIAEVKKNTSKL